MRSIELPANVRSDGCILIGDSITCDGFDPSYATRIQTNINRFADDFNSSLGYQNEIVLSQQSYELLIKDLPSLKYRNTFKLLPTDGSWHTVGETQISLLESGYMPGSGMPLVQTKEGTNILYSSDFLSIPKISLPKIDILILDAKCWNNSFSWSHTKEEVFSYFEQAFLRKIEQGPTAIVGNRGSIEAFLLLLSGQERWPIFASPRILNSLTFFTKNQQILDNIQPIDLAELRRLVESNEPFVSFFEPVDKIHRSLFSASAQILIEDTIISSTQPFREYENGLLQIILPSRADFNGVISLVQQVNPSFVLTDGSRGGNASALAEYINYHLGINASSEMHQSGLSWGGATSTLEDSFTLEEHVLREDSLVQPPTSVKRLIVIVPAEGQRTNSWSSLVNRLQEEEDLSGSEFLLWDHNYYSFSYNSVLKLSRRLKARIDEKWMYKGSFDEVIFIGHGLGSLLVRQAYLLASGTYRGYDESNWYAYVRRLILLAPLNRGLDPAKSLTMSVAVLLEKYTSIPIRWILPNQDLFRGSAFLTNLRINWIRHFRSQQEYQYPLAIIQMLSSIDGTVTRDDCIDLEQLPGARHIDVSEATYLNIHRVDKAGNPEERFKLFKEALFGVTSDYLEEISFNDKSMVVFALHGIRASNSGWVQQIRSKILEEVSDVEVITASYDYFSALNFLVPLVRKRNIEWFQDQYAYYFAKYSYATFHFIGHSNGTYILGESLRKVPEMRFTHVYLAGSVLPRDYPWRDRFDNQQLEKLRNDRSSGDWPVGLLCSGLRGIGMNDIGTGGFDGFLLGDSRAEEFYYFKGDHGKPLDKGNIDSIINFVLTGQSSISENLLSEEDVSLRFWSRASPYATRGLLILLFGIAFAGATSSNGLLLLAIVILFILARVLLNIL